MGSSPVVESGSVIGRLTREMIRKRDGGILGKR